MVKIAETTESTIHYKRRFAENTVDLENNITNAISYATCTMAHGLNAKAILTITHGGGTARMVARFHPETMIIAVTPKIKTYMRLALCWGVTPMLSEEKDTPAEAIAAAAERVVQEKLLDNGDLIIVTGSSSPHVMYTDMLQAHILGSDASYSHSP
jgi:pyruvate kinase